MKDFEYYGLFLDEESQKKLKSALLLNDKLWEYAKIMMEHDDYNYYLDHCTLFHESQLSEDTEWAIDFLNEHVNEEMPLLITAIGYNDKAMAFRLKSMWGGTRLCMNITPYITIATFNNGELLDCNRIIIWEYLEEPIKITGTLKKV